MRFARVCVVALLASACGDNLGADQPPAITPLQLTTAEDTPVDGTIAATDPEGKTVSVQLIGPQHGTVVRDGFHITYTPAADYVGPDRIVVLASDGTLDADGAVDIEVTAVNDAPVAGNDAFAAIEDVALVIPETTLLANDVDVDHDPLTITQVGAPTHGTVAITGFDVTFTPDANYNGLAQFEYTLSDGTATDVGFVGISVGGANDPPVAVDDAATTDEDVALVVTGATLIANDTDADGQTLTVTAVTNATNGTVALAAGTITFTPAADVNGTAGFDYTVSDGAATDVGHVTVTVNPVGDAPVAVADVLTATEDTPVTFVGSQLTANDTDVDGATTFTVIAVANPSHCTVSLAGGDVAFTPDPEYAGDATFEYTVSDGALTAVGVVTVAVAAVDDPPTANDDVATTPEDVPAQLAVTTLLANDTDVDGPALAITAVGNPSHGTVGLATCAVIGACVVFTPDPDYAGPAAFDYTATSGALSDTATVALDVTAVNDPPVAVDDVAITATNTPLVIAAATLLANDSDVDGPTTTVVSVATAVHGVVVLVGSTVTFVPDTNYAGAASFEYVVSDGSLTAVGRVAVTVTSACGDGVANGAEGCDDGGFSPGDGCGASCQVEVGWTCAGQPSACTPVCGDTLILGGEQCDDGNVLPGDGCGPTCRLESCGDGIRNNLGSEQCDDGNADDTDGCTTQCVTGVVCNATAFPGGDRFAVDPASGNCYVSFDDDVTSHAAAQAACVAIGGYLATIASAGEDGYVHAVQNPAQTPWLGATDDANDTDDVFVWVTGEPWGYRAFAPGEPDDNAATGGDGECVAIADTTGAWGDTACDGAATIGRICEVELAPCGDGVREPVAGEECDDGNTVSLDGCTATCQVEDGCGDGNLDAGEECDDDNLADGDGCTATCQLEVGCGNGVVDTGEACDDDNLRDFDGCSASCQVEPGATCAGTAPTTCGKLVIDEIDYDNLGTDNTGGQFEFVEILNAGTGAADLSTVALVLVNGNAVPPAEYNRFVLTDAAVPGDALPPGGMIVVGVAGLVATLPPSVYSITDTAPPVAGWLQNGTPDAIGLFDVASSTVIDALGYEGVVTGATVVGAPGTYLFTEGTSTSTAPRDDGSADESLARGPDGRDTQNNLADFTIAVPTPGLANP
jgi:cysteine-rich repeat protein